MIYIDLKPAFQWQCPICHKSEFVEAGSNRLSEEDARLAGFTYPADFRFGAVVDYEDNGVPCTERIVERVAIGPARVLCKDCKESFLCRIDAETEVMHDE